MGKRVAHNLVCNNLIDYIDIAAGYRLEEVGAPKWMFGHSLGQMELRQKHGVTAILIRHPNGTMSFSPGAEETINEGDVLVLAGSVQDLDRLERKE